MANEWKAEWTGKYPCLCDGEWKLYKNGIEVEIEIPFQKEPANTFGKYQEWWFDKDGDESWSNYVDGFNEKEWIEENRDWLSFLSNDENELRKIYHAFQKNDWRYNSCGGCI